MKVAYVIDGLSHGGAERSLLDMAPYWVDAGIDLHVIVLGGSDALRQPLSDSGVCIHMLQARSLGAQVLVLRRALGRIRPNLVHTTLAESDVLGRIAARTMSIPASSSLVNHSYGAEHFDEGPVAKLRAFQAVDAATARWTTRLHAVSASVADVMSRRLRYPRARIDIIPRGRDLARFQPWSLELQAQRRNELGLPRGVPLLGTVASHEYRKGLDVLLKSLVHLPDVHLCILGRTGRETENLREIAGDLDLTARLAWIEPRQDVETVLQACDAFVLASRREGFPGALLEAMATGLPVAASDIPPVREALGSPAESVHLARVGDSGSLARACRAALGSRPPSLGLRRRVADRYSLPSVATRMRSFFDAAAGVGTDPVERANGDLRSCSDDPGPH